MTHSTHRVLSGAPYRPRSEVLYCSFCGKSAQEVFLIAGPTVYICEECVGLCVGILEERTVRQRDEFETGGGI